MDLDRQLSTRDHGSDLEVLITTKYLLNTNNGEVPLYGAHTKTWHVWTAHSNSVANMTKPIAILSITAFFFKYTVTHTYGST